MAPRLNTQALIKQIITDIRASELADDHGKFPAEPELMQRYQVTRYTLRQALKQLSDMGYTYQSHGVGTFVRPPQAQNSIALQHNGGLSEEVARQGRELKTKIAHKRVVTVSDAEFLPDNYQLDPTEQLIEIQRFRLLDNQPYLLEHSYYLQSEIKVIPNEALYGSLFKYLERQRATQVSFIDQLIMSEPLPADAGEFFELPTGAPSLVVRDDSYLSTGNLLAFSKQYYDYRIAKLFMVKKIH